MLLYKKLLRMSFGMARVVIIYMKNWIDDVGLASVVGQLWRLLCQYYEYSFRGGRLITELYPFLYQALSKKNNPASTTCKYVKIIPSTEVFCGSVVIKLM
jgi:hypothetical protein